MIIGAIFTGASLVSTATFIVPLLAVLPGMELENIAAQLLSNEPYSNVGKFKILILSVLFILVFTGAFIVTRRMIIRSGQISKIWIILVMSVLFFIVHPLGFYIYWGTVLDFRSDGQLIFSVLNTFPFSSFAFAVTGFLLDMFKEKQQRGAYADTGTDL